MRYETVIGLEDKGLKLNPIPTTAGIWARNAPGEHFSQARLSVSSGHTINPYRRRISFAVG